MKRNKALFYFLAVAAMNLSVIGQVGAEEYKIIFSKTAKPFVAAAVEAPVVPITGNSCKERMDNGDTTSGVKTLDSGIDVYCDMTTDGGGWTMVVAQFENDIYLGWDEGIQSDYDPTLSTNKTFMLNNSQIPSHTQTAFGNNLNPTSIGYINFTYNTGDIPLTTVTDLKTGATHHLSRHKNKHYGNHDPEFNSGVSSSNILWDNTLSFDKTGGSNFTWAFAVGAEEISRGYSLGGFRGDVADSSYIWTVWVR